MCESIWHWNRLSNIKSPYSNIYIVNTSQYVTEFCPLILHIFYLSNMIFVLLPSPVWQCVCCVCLFTGGCPSTSSLLSSPSGVSMPLVPGTGLANLVQASMQLSMVGVGGDPRRKGATLIHNYHCFFVVVLYLHYNYIFILFILVHELRDWKTWLEMEV